EAREVRAEGGRRPTELAPAAGGVLLAGRTPLEHERVAGLLERVLDALRVAVVADALERHHGAPDAGGGEQHDPDGDDETHRHSSPDRLDRHVLCVIPCHRSPFRGASDPPSASTRTGPRNSRSTALLPAHPNGGFTDRTRAGMRTFRIPARLPHRDSA